MCTQMVTNRIAYRNLVHNKCHNIQVQLLHKWVQMPATVRTHWKLCFYRESPRSLKDPCALKLEFGVFEADMNCENPHSPLFNSDVGTYLYSGIMWPGVKATEPGRGTIPEALNAIWISPLFQMLHRGGNPQMPARKLNVAFQMLSWWK